MSYKPIDNTTQNVTKKKKHCEAINPYSLYAAYYLWALLGQEFVRSFVVKLLSAGMLVCLSGLVRQH